MPNPVDNSVPTLTVSQLNRRVRSMLETQLDFIWVEGEISNFAAPSSGHWYFSLKDGSAQVRCALFKNRNQRLRFTPANGDAVRLRARVSLYEARGEFQLIGEFLEQAGAGALQAQFEQLKANLLAEGLFDPSRKQPLPQSVSHVGVITSPTGAALHDILTVLARRCPGIKVSLLPVPVQGDEAPGKIVQALEQANRWQSADKIALDVLIVGRGGGSLEDLWAFNEEIVARAIAASDLPVVSAVGHEVDFSIADMVADQRAATPSAAAELVSPDQQEWLYNLLGARADLGQAMLRRLRHAQTNIEHLRSRIRHPGARLREQAQRLDDLEQRLILAQQGLLRQHSNDTAVLNSRLRGASPLHRLQRLQGQLDERGLRLRTSIQARLQDGNAQLARYSGILQSLSPLATLARGYAIITDASGRVVTNANEVSTGDEIRARLAAGELDLVVRKVKPAD
ncbi:MAG: exodeoxyribonuclease VII large subunit [Bacteroidia bacterium]